jgi:ABC-type branched-subunit amino acid transport system substrate-binding protein
MRAFTLFALALGGLACSATRVDQTACQNHGECRETFGFGATCNQDGLCAPAAPTARCKSSYPEDLWRRPLDYKDAVVVGSLMDRLSEAHKVRERAIRLAVEEADGNGGIEGRKMAAVFCDIADGKMNGELGDNLGRLEAAVADAKFMSEKLGIAVIVGPSASSDVGPVWEALHLPGTVLLAPAATAVTLLTLEPTSTDEAPGFLWRMAPPDSLQGALIVQDMNARQVKGVFVIRQSDAYGDGLSKVVQEQLMAGGKMVDIATITNDTQIGEAVAAAADSTADEILFISSQQALVSSFLNAVSGLADRFAKRGIFLTDSAANEDVLKGSKAATALFPRVRGSRPKPRTLMDHVFASFVANYKSKYGGADPTGTSFVGHSYDAAWLGIYGAAWSLVTLGKVEGIGVARGLRHVSMGTPTDIVPSSLQKVVQSFRAMTPVNVTGASSELDFDPITRDVPSPFEIWLVDSSTMTPRIVAAP